jgi:hypothetical protein
VAAFNVIPRRLGNNCNHCDTTTLALLRIKYTYPINVIIHKHTTTIQILIITTRLEEEVDAVLNERDTVVSLAEGVKDG